MEVPTSVREALGDKVALDLLSWFIRVIPKEVIVRLDNLERELKGLRTEMDRRLDNPLETVHARIDSRGTRMLVQSRWLIGSIAVLGTVISILLAIGQFLR